MEGPSMHSKCLAFIPFNFWEALGPGGGEGGISFHFSLVPNVFPNIILQCVLSHFHLLKPLEPHPHPLILFQVGFFFNIYKFYFFLFFTLYLVSSFLEIFLILKLFYCISFSLFHLFPFLFYSFCVFTFFFCLCLFHVFIFSILILSIFIFFYFYVFIYLFSFFFFKKILVL